MYINREAQSLTTVQTKTFLAFFLYSCASEKHYYLKSFPAVKTHNKLRRNNVIDFKQNT